MCSILGYFNSKLSLNEINKLNCLLSNRGPDNSEVKKYKFKDKNLYLAHNRLAIQDLDEKANQPMENDYFAIVFNGEIYNHFEIRNKLTFNNFKTTSDTETILWAFTEFGVEKSIQLFNGMFAISLFDKKNHKLYLIRDRVGIKPLYYTFQNDEFAFSSELKGFSKHLKQHTSNKALIQFMSFGYIPSDQSYYENIYKLKPAHFLAFDGKNIKIQKYWDLPQKKIDISFEEAVNQAENLIRSSIKYRLLADVEVGSFLSGGVDSSLVSSIMQQEANQQIKTFSIGFERKDYDESEYARKIAKHIKSNHYEYVFSVKDTLKLIENFDHWYDEPFGDASALPTMLLSEFTKENVTVSLSGDGGDELFLGYDRYFLTHKYFNLFEKIPQNIRNILYFVFKFSNVDKFEKLAFVIKNLSKENLYSLLYTSIKPWEIESIFSKEFVREYFQNVSLLDLLGISNFSEDSFENFSKIDFFRYLPDDILVKVDRASMRYALEARVPLLDHRLVEFAHSLPTDIKLKYGSKSILKQILYKYVPQKLIDRPKMGFSVPLKYWFRNELKNLAFDKINSLDKRFNKEFLKKIFKKHQSGKNYEYVLWNIMKIK